VVVQATIVPAGTYFQYLLSTRLLICVDYMLHEAKTQRFI
jgi:hypothetical protein